jgi:hypothetical protein
MDRSSGDQKIQPALTLTPEAFSAWLLGLSLWILACIFWVVLREAPKVVQASPAALCGAVGIAFLFVAARRQRTADHQATETEQVGPIEIGPREIEDDRPSGRLFGPTYYPDSGRS